MFFTFALVTALAIAPVDTVPADTAPAAVPAAGPFVQAPVGIGAPSPAVVDDTTPSRRRKAVEISDMYALRLKIHYIASYATIPIFAAQAVVGEQLYNAENKGNPPPAGMKGLHDGIAVALLGLFGVNTITGAWNWWETRHQEKGRTWRTVHGALMLLADAGFAYTAALGSNAQFERNGGNPARDLHRNWAEASAGVALASYIMMWKPFRRD
jgi:hypothetical protein